MVVSGHSVGGYLTLTIDWTAQGTGAPGDIVKAAIPISGIFDLEPIRHTSINDVIGMDAGEARRQSPLFMSSR
jgi:arylformamidase